MNQKIKVLGISGSIRHGNSEYLLKKSLEAAKKVAPEKIETEFYSMAGKIINPCLSCLSCIDHRECIIRDDFEELFDKWLSADAIIYSVPVFHLGLPAHFKAFIDRLGQTLFAKYSDKPPKLLKVIGVITQGTDLGGGEELAAINIITHALVMGCIPIAGDPPQSYIGALGWTKRSPMPDAFERMIDEGDYDAKVTLEAALSLGKRVAYTTLIIREGVYALKDFLRSEPSYTLIINKILEEKRLRKHER